MALGSKPQRGATTLEPAHRPSRAPVFVVQEHDATSLHYDFRLEAQGVLKSWAVPRGPSLNPRDRRLAIPTADHPLDYATFEGVIPDGEHGAGPVLIWDRGTYENLSRDVDGRLVSLEEGLAMGHIAFHLHGRKLRGGFALTEVGVRGGRSRWVLVKMADEAADRSQDVTTERPESVLSGRVLSEVGPQRHPWA